MFQKGHKCRHEENNNFLLIMEYYIYCDFFKCTVPHYLVNIWLLWKKMKAWTGSDLGTVGRVVMMLLGTAFDMIFTD